MQLPKPRNIEEAQEQARVNGRARTLWQQGYSVEDAEYGYTVISDEGDRYQVDPIFETCTCPFFEKKGYCKHILGLPALLDNQRGAQLAMLARMETEQKARAQAEGPSGCDFSDGPMSSDGCHW